MKLQVTLERKISDKNRRRSERIISKRFFTFKESKSFFQIKTRGERHVEGLRTVREVSMRKTRITAFDCKRQANNPDIYASPREG